MLKIGKVYGIIGKNERVYTFLYVFRHEWLILKRGATNHHNSRRIEDDIHS